MKSRLLTFDDLYNFYSKYTKSKHFNCDEQGCEPIVVQTPATIKFEKSEIYEGLTAVRLQACHTERNLNSSSISKEVMENKLLPTFKNRPILGYIHEVDGKPQFYGHNMHLSDDGEEIIYDEIPVGIIPESNESELVYNADTEKYEVFVSGYIFDEYTKATDIIEREQELAVSVEISIKQMSYSPKDSCLNIEDGYFSGVTILGVNEKGQKVNPGMAGSNIKLKDFSQSNNSMFANQTEETNQKLIETLDKLNETLTKFNIKDSQSNEIYGKEEQESMNEEIKVEEEVTEVETVEETAETVEEFTEETVEEVVDETVEETVEEVTETEEFTEEVAETETEETVEEGTPEVGEETEATSEETTEVEFEESETDEEETEDEEVEETNEDEEKENFELIEKTFEVDGRKFSISFELSHNDIAYGLYNLLGSYCELDNEWYDIRAVYDDRFVFQGWFTGKIYGQKYSKNDDVVALEGERYELFEELLTVTEKAELESIRSNYSSIQTELNAYKEAELNAQREAVFADEAYAEFVEDARFVEIKENMNTYSVEELKEKCDLAFAACVKAKGNFALNHEEEKPKAPTMFAFGRIEQKSSFLDGLLKK